MNAPLEQIAGYGITGALLVVALFTLRSLHQELAAERSARIQDAKDGMKIMLAFQKEVLVAVDRLTDLYSMLKEERAEEKARRLER